jgi:hypothetical protein
MTGASRTIEVFAGDHLNVGLGEGLPWAQPNESKVLQRSVAAH